MPTTDPRMFFDAFYGLGIVEFEDLKISYNWWGAGGGHLHHPATELPVRWSGRAQRDI